MNANLTFAMSGFLHRTRFVVVNDRIPRTDGHCALCGKVIERGYVRDSQTRLITATRSVFQVRQIWQCPSSKIARGRCHEMLKSLLQSRYWLARPSARLVQQTALLLKELPLCLRG